MTTGTQILSIAKKHLGETGSPTWSAYGAIGGQKTGWAWCCAFVWRVFREAGASALFYGGAKTASCGVADSWLYRNCKWVKYSEAKAGDIVLFTWYPTGGSNTRSGSEISHIGIFESRISDSEFYAIEGNTKVRTTDVSKVMRRARNRKWIYAIYRPNYSNTVSAQCIQSVYNGTDAQMWTTVSEGEFVKIINKKGKVLDLRGGSISPMKDGRAIQTHGANGTDAQLWKLIKSPVGGYLIASKLDPSFVIDATGGAVNKRAKIQLHRRQTANANLYAQSWHIMPTNSGYFAIVNAKSFFVLDTNPTNINL